MQENKSKNSLVTVLIIVGITLFYVMQMAPSPVLLVISKFYGLTNDTLINLAIDIIFPFIVLGCLTGGPIEHKIGTRNMYTLALVLVALGVLMNLVAESSYAIMLAGRSVFGLGFGFGVPFIGAAIMKWYPPHKRETMDTINGLFPFIGTMICFLIMMPLYYLFGNDWQWALGVWGFPIVAVLLIWLFCIKQKDLPNYATDDEITSQEKGIYRKLLKYREIRLICLTFICDFTCYSYIAVILPTFLYEASSMSESVANLVAAFAFPAIGIVGCTIGGITMSKSGRRKPTLIMGQVFKLVGILIATLLTDVSVVFIVLGAAVFGFGNGLWMPSMYCVPMDLKGMTPARVGSAFALITAVGLSFGFISPTVGGWITTVLMNKSGILDSVANHVFGLRWSLFIFGFVNIIGSICMIKIPETGPSKKA